MNMGEQKAAHQYVVVIRGFLLSRYLSILEVLYTTIVCRIFIFD